MKEQMKIDLEIIRQNKVEKYAVEYIRLDRQEEELQRQGKLNDSLLEMFENRKKELVNKSYTYHKELEEKMVEDLNKINDMMINAYRNKIDKMSIPTCVEDYM